jgi:hypothetical protein
MAHPRAIELKQWLQPHRQQVHTLNHYQKHFEDILLIAVKVLSISPKLMIETKKERATYGLMTGNSLHVGSMRRKPITLSDIVTYDGDFST